ncbi:MAG: cyclase family protein [Bacilli bacterium]|nr:cyclase family protein [Bacilli bacterium]
MYLDLTINVSQKSPLIQWAKSQENPYIAMGHIGTHLDTYEKSNIPIDYFKSIGVIFDVRNIDEVSCKDINLNDVPENSFVIFRTGHIEKYSYGEKEYFDNHPQLSHNLISMLCQKKIRFIGIDCAGIRQHQDHEKADRFCEKHGVYVIENLCNLDKIVKNNFLIYTMWLNEEELTGLKCRVIVDSNYSL